MCPFCGKRHQPVPLGGGGLAAIYSRPLDPVDDPYRSRPMPLSRAGPVHDLALRRDAFNVWRAGPAEAPPTPTPSVRERLAHLWQGDP
jgi:hypothetical protein